MKVTASLKRDGREQRRGSMKYAGEVSHFATDLPAVDAGTYTLRVVASNPKTVNFAMYEVELKVK